jgi:dTDP-4-dehydrorhamnose reductase
MVTYLLSDAAELVNGSVIDFDQTVHGPKGDHVARWRRRRRHEVRVYLTGATGFVGSSVARVFAERHGAEVHCSVHRQPPPSDAGYSWDRVDLTDAAAVARSVAQARPDVIVHTAILNDLTALGTDRERAWAAYVGATRNIVDAANAAGAQLVLVSSDWVFDGTQGGATESTPPNPINLYGFLKAASELVVSERAERGAVARLGGVQGAHWARPRLPRRQDEGFGYLVAALVESVRAGQRFGVWESPAINMVATPTLATDAATLLWRIVERRRAGTYHCCAAETVDRATLARRAAETFELDSDLIDLHAGYPPGAPSVPVPFDTGLSAEATAKALDVRLPALGDWLERLRRELDTGEIGPDPFDRAFAAAGEEAAQA